MYTKLVSAWVEMLSEYLKDLPPIIIVIHSCYTQVVGL